MYKENKHYNHLIVVHNNTLKHLVDNINALIPIFICYLQFILVTIIIISYYNIYH